MANKPTCLVCKKDMELGFLTDRAGGFAVHLPRWCRGTPGERSLLQGGDVKFADAKQGLKVVAYRCPQCEALRLYAPSHE